MQSTRFVIITTIKAKVPRAGAHVRFTSLYRLLMSTATNRFVINTNIAAHQKNVGPLIRKGDVADMVIPLSTVIVTRPPRTDANKISMVHV